MRRQRLGISLQKSLFYGRALSSPSGCRIDATRASGPAARATQFEYGLCAIARDAGFEDLVTHIHAENAAARGWAERMGWRPYGMITRYQLDIPVLRKYGVFLLGNGATVRATA